MKKNVLVLLLALIACAGCATHYDMLLTNGMVITSHGKPHLDKEGGRYLYTDANGKPAAIPRLRVREIAPQSMRKKEGSQFISQ